MIVCGRAEAERKIGLFAEQLCGCPSEGFFCIKKFVGTDGLSVLHNQIAAVPFRPLVQENVLWRHEVIGLKGSILRIPELEEFVSHIREAIHDFRELAVERHAFRYEIGQSLPPHRDKVRHKITAILYFGEFLGGEFSFEVNNRKKYLVLSGGDVIISVNELPDGPVLNPIHWVKEIRKGTRYCSVVSYVSEKTSPSEELFE